MQWWRYWQKSARSHPTMHWNRTSADWMKALRRKRGVSYIELVVDILSFLWNTNKTHSENVSTLIPPSSRPSLHPISFLTDHETSWDADALDPVHFQGTSLPILPEFCSIIITTSHSFSTSLGIMATRCTALAHLASSSTTTVIPNVKGKDFQLQWIEHWFLPLYSFSRASSLSLSIGNLSIFPDIISIPDLVGNFSKRHYFPSRPGLSVSFSHFPVIK